MALAAGLRPFVELVSLRNFTCSRSMCLLQRHFSQAADGMSGRGSSEETDDEGPKFDTKYRTPTEVLWPATKHQQRFAFRLHNAISNVLLNNAPLRDTLVQELGFAVKDVRMSPDNLKAFILWDSILGQQAVLHRELNRQMPKLRSAVAQALGARNVPRLVFKHDGLTQRQQQIEDVFRQLEEEEALEAQQQEEQQQRQQQEEQQRRQAEAQHPH